MRVSVIIPVFNRPEMVKRALNSVLNQTLLPDELIVVNDGSTDQTGKILENFKDRIEIITTVNRGVSPARNTGVSASRGDFLAFLDSDDEWLPRKLERQMEFHRLNPEFLISQTNEIWIRKGRRVNQKIKHAKKSGWIFQDCLPLCIITPSAVMMSRELWNETGGFDEALPACEDYDMWLRIASKYKVGLVEENLLIRYAGHEGQLSGKYWGMDRFRITALEGILKHDLSSDDRLATLEILNQKLAIFCKGLEKRNRKEELSLYRQKLEKYSKNEELTEPGAYNK